VLRHSVNIRLWERKRVLHQFQARRRSFGDDHFDNVEAKQDVGIIQQTKPRETAARNSFPFIAIDGIERPAEILPGARFDLDENERVALAADDVDFAARAPAEITIQDFVTVPPQELAGQFLPARPKP
jgi:hypothetical protein